MNREKDFIKLHGIFVVSHVRQVTLASWKFSVKGSPSMPNGSFDLWRVTKLGRFYFDIASPLVLHMDVNPRSLAS